MDDWIKALDNAVAEAVEASSHEEVAQNLEQWLRVIVHAKDIIHSEESSE